MIILKTNRFIVAVMPDQATAPKNALSTAGTQADSSTAKAGNMGP